MFSSVIPISERQSDSVHLSIWYKKLSPTLMMSVPLNQETKCQALTIANMSNQVLSSFENIRMKPRDIIEGLNEAAFPQVYMKT